MSDEASHGLTTQPGVVSYADVEAFAQCCNALHPLTIDARERVLRAAAVLLGIELPPKLAKVYRGGDNA